jgi:hypothetical protein
VEAVKANILAAKTVSRTLRSSLGPKGMDKMLQSPDGDVTISEALRRGVGVRGPGCFLGRRAASRQPAGGRRARARRAGGPAGKSQAHAPPAARRPLLL